MKNSIILKELSENKIDQVIGEDVKGGWQWWWETTVISVDAISGATY